MKASSWLKIYEFFHQSVRYRDNNRIDFKTEYIHTLCNVFWNLSFNLYLYFLSYMLHIFLHPFEKPVSRLNTCRMHIRLSKYFIRMYYILVQKKEKKITSPSHWNFTLRRINKKKKVNNRYVRTWVYHLTAPIQTRINHDFTVHSALSFIRVNKNEKDQKDNPWGKFDSYK